MPWWTSMWAHGVGWTLLYALAVWGVSAILSLLEQRLESRGLHDVAAWGQFLIPLILAFFIGVRLRSWWWVFGPPLAIILTALTYTTIAFLTSPRPDRQEAGGGLILAIFLTAIDAGAAILAATAGVVSGKVLPD